MVFPGVQKETWTFDEQAQAWYFHRFYDFEPDLNHGNPAVREEIRKIIGFWLRLGIAGFRVDALPFVISLPKPDTTELAHDYPFLNEMRNWVSWRRGDAVVLAEANVPDGELPEYVGSAPHNNDRMHMLFNFRLNDRILLALARRQVEPITWALRTAPRLPAEAQWATFIRNHDEADLSQLSDDERKEVFAVFAPDDNMRLYGRGIRRRLAPMLDGDRRRLELAYSLQFTLPGTPVLRYGEEIGMGDDLDLPERNSIRTPMQWSADENAGFSTAPASQLVRPLVHDGRFSPEKVNVSAQRGEPDSLLGWMERVLRTLRECPEVGENSCEVLESGHASVLAHRYAGPHGAMLFLHNLDDHDRTVHLGDQLRPYPAPIEATGRCRLWRPRAGRHEAQRLGLPLDPPGIRSLTRQSRVSSCSTRVRRRAGVSLVSAAGCSTTAITRVAMKRPTRTGCPVRVSSATSTTPRAVVTSTRLPMRVAEMSNVCALPVPVSMTISTRSPITCPL